MNYTYDTVIETCEELKVNQRFGLKQDIHMRDVIILISVIITVYLSFIVKIAKEYERFAVFYWGRYRGLKGPGLLFKFSSREVQWYRLSVGNHGTLLAPDVGQFGNVKIPIEIEKNVKIGSIISIVGFSDTAVKAMYFSDGSHTIICSKCGHEMKI